MNGVTQRSIRRGNIALTVAILLALASSPGVSQAGVMLAPVDTDSIGMVAASTAPTPHADDQDPQLIEPPDQEFAMTRSSNGSGGYTFPVVGSSFGYQSAQPELVAWLVTHCRLVIPSPIPLSLLKVPIEIA